MTLRAQSLSIITKLRLSVELLEERLTPSWTSVPPASVTLPTSPVALVQNTLGDANGTAGIASTEVDWFRFTSLTTGSAVFQATTPSSSVDTVMALYNSSGSRVAYNDDISGSNTDSRFTVNLVAGQTYYFGVTNYINTAGGAYSWSLNADTGTTPPPPSTDDSYENNDTISTANNLGTLTASRTISNLVMADGNDWYRFTLSTAGTSTSSIVINFQHAQGDLDLELYTSSGTRLAFSAGTSNTETISLSNLAAGTYHVRVLGYQGAANPNYSMVLTPGSGGTTPPPPTGGGYNIQLRMTGLTASQQAIFQQAVNRWQSVIIGDLPNTTYNGVAVDDLLIDASARVIDGRGGILGQAGPDRFRTGTSLPFHGTMQFDSADLASLEVGGGLLYTVMHEIGHVLGIGTIWSTRGLLSGAGSSNPRFTGAQATAAYNAIFGRNETGVPVENSGGSGTRDSHWRETTFGNELMTGYLNNGFNPLSRITIGSLADLGYQVDFSQADGYSPGTSSFRAGGGGNTGGTSLRLAVVDAYHVAAIPFLSETTRTYPSIRNNATPLNLDSVESNLQSSSKADNFFMKMTTPSVKRVSSDSLSSLLDGLLSGRL